MRIAFGIIFIISGVIVLIFGNRQFGTYGPVSKWFFNPPWHKEKWKVFNRNLMRWAFGGILIYLGATLLFY